MSIEDHGWTHPICEACYAAKYPGRIPARMAESYREVEVCCWCLKLNQDGIYYRDDPKAVHAGAV